MNDDDDDDDIRNAYEMSINSYHTPYLTHPRLWQRHNIWQNVKFQKCTTKKLTSMTEVTQPHNTGRRTIIVTASPAHTN